MASDGKVTLTTDEFDTLWEWVVMAHRAIQYDNAIQKRMEQDAFMACCRMVDARRAAAVPTEAKENET